MSTILFSLFLITVNLFEWRKLFLSKFQLSVQCCTKKVQQIILYGFELSPLLTFLGSLLSSALLVTFLFPFNIPLIIYPSLVEIPFGDRTLSVVVTKREGEYKPLREPLTNEPKKPSEVLEINTST